MIKDDSKNQLSLTEKVAVSRGSCYRVCVTRDACVSCCQDHEEEIIHGVNQSVGETRMG